MRRFPAAWTPAGHSIRPTAACTRIRTWSLVALGVFIAGFSSILTGLNFIVTIHKMRAPGMTWFRLPLFIWAMYATSLIFVLGTPVIAITLFLLRHGASPACGNLRSGRRRRSAAVPASFLVLFPSGRVHHDFARNGSGQRIDHRVFAQENLRLRLRGVFELGHRRDQLRRLGPPHVRHRPVDLRGPGLLRAELPGRDPVGGQSVQLDGHTV